MTENVLVVDDDRQTTSFLDRFLTKQGYAVQTVGSAMQMGLSMEHRHFTLVLRDVRLPDIDAFEVTRELLARIRSVLRRTKAAVPAHDALPEARSIHFNGFALDLPGRSLVGPDNRAI